MHKNTLDRRQVPSCGKYGALLLYDTEAKGRLQHRKQMDTLFKYIWKCYNKVDM